ncbi:sugar transferase [Microvirga terricola]|uniref:Sugar transferase n=1 Tax=Microvirga terricola TaxID=2719797 RepID=A0ABX0V8L2_9HYPH|nr:sugar transferase [Microvirga terricola]NIX76194.1 sugar transferase [Microvirga terricola]
MGEPHVPQVPSSTIVRSLDATMVLGSKIATPFHLGLGRVSRFGKRSLDILVASLALFLSLPLLLVIAVFVAMDGGPVLYSHRRIGTAGVPFGCLKFRTMILDADQCLEEYLSYHPEACAEWARNQKLTFDPRVTAVGRFLRQSSFDELPQLINVLKDEMSLVGPRPVTQSEMAHYGPVAALYKSVRPGITGLWQVSGRNDVGYETRVKLDEHYVKNWSFGSDLLILFRTPTAVLSRRGAK